MLSQKVVRLDRDEKKIIVALLLHPRLIAIRREFQERVAEVLGDDAELERISRASHVSGDDLVSRTQHLLLEMATDGGCESIAFDEAADIAMAFFVSPRFINVWGHFTMALQKIMLDEQTVGEVAAACGASGNDHVRRAIRHFSTESGLEQCPDDEQARQAAPDVEKRGDD